MCIYAVASWAQYYPSSNYFHCFVSAFLMYGILSGTYYDSYFALDNRDMSVVLLGDTTFNNKIYSMRYHSETYENDIFPYLNGMRVSPEQVRFYGGITERIAEARSRWPDHRKLCIRKIEYKSKSYLKRQGNEIAIFVPADERGESENGTYEEK